MKQSKFTPEQIASVLKEFENGKNVQEITRKHGVSSFPNSLFSYYAGYFSSL